MKRLLIVFSLIAMIVGFSACNEVEKKLEREVAAAAAQCPISLGMMGEVSQIQYLKNDRLVKVVYSINDEMVDIGILKQSEEQLIDAVKMSFMQESAHNMLEMMVDANFGMLCVYQNKIGGEAFELTIPVSEIKEIVDNKMSDQERKEQLLASQMALENAHCPYEVDEGLTMTATFDDGKYIVYECTIDENIYSLESFEDIKDELKGNIANQFNDEAVSQQVQLMSSLGRGLVYRYKGNMSGKALDIAFTPEELSVY